MTMNDKGEHRPGTDSGIASYGALGHMPPSTSNCFCHFGLFRASQTLTLDSMWLHIPRNNIQAYSSDMVYCTNFITFVCVTLKLFYSIFGPLLAPNPVKATDRG